ncbi:MAG: alpha/beta hydrolase [Actinobacteria bacterium]|nr:MAG: alpha/beta hydrolase [Actinomycetota bacterium]
MRSIILLIRIWIAANLAIAKATFRRMLLGATLPTWTWRTEWAVASARRVIAVAADHKEDPWINDIGLRFKTPLPASLRGAVEISPELLGHNLGDHYQRVGTTRRAAMILYFHGGGYTFGNPGTHREHIARLVARTGTAATAPRYRLAPTHRFPAAVDDAIDSYRALLTYCSSSREVIVSGDSAGAGLAVAMVHRARAEGLPLPAGLILFSPYVDIDHDAYTIRTNASTDYLPVRELSTPNDWYASPEHRTDPEASPIRADLSGFPPMLVLAGGAEMMLADSLRLSENAKRDGVECELIIEPEMPHVWPAMLPWEPASKRALKACAEWIPRTVNREP